MFAYFTGILSLFDATIRALMGVEVLSLFFFFSVLCMVLSLFSWLRSAAVGRGKV